RSLTSFIVWLPWAVPGLVLGVVILDLTLNVPPLSVFYGTMAPVVLALLIKEMPIGVQLLRSAVEQTPQNLEEAASVSGSSRGRTFQMITLPLIAPALAAVFLFIFAAAVRDISTIVLIAPPDMQTLSLLMFSYANIGDFEAAAVIGTMVAVISLALAIAARILSKRTGVVR
ncbi:MAG: ABC transporter permease subunit, partial [Hyphomicrobiales bacterium]|nr:ABC transporter permease subunit [Hyphomicrobiales bacterium]